MGKDFVLLNKCFINTNTEIGSFCCVMHFAVIKEKRWQSLIHCQNYCYPGVIRKIRDLFFSAAGPPFHMLRNTYSEKP